jgi:trk system potassium uptake protein
MQLFKAEMAGPLKESRLTARIADTAKLLWFVYLGLTIIAIVSLRLAGMSWFDAVCHAFSSVALGGFSTRDSSIGAFDSPAIEAVLCVVMIVAGINFALHFTALRARSYRLYIRDAEASVYLWILGASVLLVAGYLYAMGTYPEFLTALRHAFFNVVSIGTGTGYASVDYSLWPIFAPMLMLFLPNITPCAGSTGGGIKLVRALILYKQARRELNKLLHPNIADLIKLGGFMVPNKVAFSVLGFIFLYFMTTVTMTFVMLLTGADFLSAFSAVVACITNLGPALGIAGPASNYGAFSDFQKWVLAATMLLGRLEIMSVVVIFTRHFWRK